MAHNQAVTGKGRPRTGTPIQVRIPAELLERIDTDRKQAGLSRAEQIRQILINHYSKDTS